MVVVVASLARSLVHNCYLRKIKKGKKSLDDPSLGRANVFHKLLRALPPPRLRARARRSRSISTGA